MARDLGADDLEEDILMILGEMKLFLYSEMPAQCPLINKQREESHHLRQPKAPVIKRVLLVLNKRSHRSRDHEYVAFASLNRRNLIKKKT